VSPENPDRTSDADWVAIGFVARTRGNRGELLAIPLAGRPERFEGLERVWLFGSTPDLAHGRRYDVDSVWLHDGKPVLKFRGIDSISDAEPLAGAEIRLPLSERTPLEPGEFYQADLVGCAVVERSGACVGQVSGWREYGGPMLLVVTTTEGAELLVPFARAICVEIDLAARRIVVALPEGLKELNRP
jgi:16S rRNA processing protein RimM